MENNLTIVKGIHPGIVLERELKKRSLPKGPFALSINAFPQTLSAITKGKRNMNIPLALKIEEALGWEEGYLMTLQVFYDIKQEKLRQNLGQHPDFAKLRPILFWDTRMEKIDWPRQKRAVIERVFERGNEQEKQEITHFYGEDVINSILKGKKDNLKNA
jgi:plasmid maintenance system antidote protein VapI